MTVNLLEMKPKTHNPSLCKCYKSLSMKSIIEEILSLSFENELIFIYGEKGTEKEYIIELILQQIKDPYIIKIPEEIDKKSFSDIQRNIVYIVNEVTNFDSLSFFPDVEKFKCAIFKSDLDFEELYSTGRISNQCYELLLKAKKLFIPPLIERRQDIIPLANFFLKEIGSFLNMPPKELSREAKEAISDYPWTYNTYQLKQYLTKAFILSRHQKLTPKDIFGEFSDKLSIKNFLEAKIGCFLKDIAKIENSNLYDTVIQEVEKALFSIVLNETGNNQVKASKILGINRNTLSKKLKLYNLI